MSPGDNKGTNKEMNKLFAEIGSNEGIGKTSHPEVNSETTEYRNPLAKNKYRNDPCVCGSGKKIKKCCGKDTFVDFETFGINAANKRDFILRMQKALKENDMKTVSQMTKLNSESI